MAQELYDVKSEYNIGKMIGKGMTGQVYKAERKSDGKIFAIKVIRMKYLKQTEREYKVLSSIKTLKNGRCHKHIICYNGDFHIGEINGQKFIIIVMEYLDGYDLEKYIENLFLDYERISDDLLKKFMRVMLKTVNFLHRNNIAHRDIKPGNIIYTKDDLVLIDFGFSCIESCVSLVGTPNYVSPELAELLLKDDNKSQSIEFWKRNDVWALGIVFYKLLFLSVPYNSKTKDGLFNEIVKETTHVEYSDKVIENVINLCLTKSAEERPTAEYILNQMI